ncbi:MAG: flagellar M-ring protein FliF [Deltaproteobacteria bacterium]|nr:flagellar M-ring protein FliF [Deltaproteobacteria bacterium]
MSDGMIQALNQIKRLLSRFSALSPQQKKMLFVGIPVFLGSVFAGRYFLQQAFYRPLFTQLSPQDAAAVLRELEARKIPYRLRSDGSVIDVPKNVLDRTRLELVGKGLPMGSGVGFEIFEHSSFGVSEFTQRVNYLRALQGELSRTINAMEPVKSSRVHLALPNRSGFLGPEEKPSASVVVELRPGANLTSEQSRGIVRLVATSVPGLAPEKVTVVDTSGRLLTSLDARGGGTEPDNLHRLRSEYEKELETRVQTMLEPVLGVGRAITRVNVQLSFQEMEQTREEFDPSGQVVRSQQQSIEGSSTPASGVPGVQSNVPGGDGKKTAEKPKEATPSRSNQMTSYEIGRTTSRISEPRGQIKRLSVAVMVDGKYQNNVYSPRSKEEIDALKAIVMKAVGFDEERGDQIEVVNFPIPVPAGGKNEETPAVQVGDWLPSPIRIGIGAGALLFLLLMKSVVKRISAKRKAKREASSIAEGPPASRVEVQKISGELKKVEVVSDPRREQLVQIARDYHQMSVRLLRAWLTEEDRKKGFVGGRPTPD